VQDWPPPLRSQAARAALRPTTGAWLGSLPPDESTPRILVPDSEHYHGLNDRLALMNGPAAQLYFGRDQYCGPPGSGIDPFGGAYNMEGLLLRVLNRSGALIGLFPTVGSLGCCAEARESCFLAKCKRGCYNRTQVTARLVTRLVTPKRL